MRSTGVGLVSYGCTKLLLKQHYSPPRFVRIRSTGVGLVIYGCTKLLLKQHSSPPDLHACAVLARDPQSLVIYDSKGAFVGVRRPDSGNAIEVEGLSLVVDGITGSTGVRSGRRHSVEATGVFVGTSHICCHQRRRYAASVWMAADVPCSDSLHGRSYHHHHVATIRTTRTIQPQIRP